jgi:hypothetical protein
MKACRTAILLGSLAALPLACLAVSSCRSASYGSVTTAGAEKAGPAGPSTPARLVAEYDALAGEILATRKKEVEIVDAILKAAHADALVALGKARSAIRSGDRKAAQASLEDLAAAVGFIGTEGDGACARVRKRLVEGGHHHNPAAGHANAHGQNHSPAHGNAHHSPGQGEHHSKGDGAPPAGEGAHHAKPGAEGHAKSPEGHAKSPEGHAKSGEPHAHASSGHGFDLGYVVVDRGTKKTFVDASQAIAQISTAPDAAALDQEWAKVETAWAALWKARK